MLHTPAGLASALAPPGSGCTQAAADRAVNGSATHAGRRKRHIDPEPPRAGSPNRGAVPYADCAERARLVTSAAERVIEAAAMFSSRCDTEPVPGIGRIDGDRASIHASTICLGVASWP